MATEKIFARSPYYVALKDNRNVVAKVNVYVWAYEGVIVSDRPTSPIYSLEKTASVTEGGYEWFTFEIAELLKDYLPKVGNPTTYPATAMWGGVQIKISYNGGGTPLSGDIQNFAVFDGYVKFEEGSQSMVGEPAQFVPDIDYTFDRPQNGLKIFTDAGKNENFFKSTDKGSTFVPVYQEETASARTVNFYTNAGIEPIQTVPSTDSSDIIQYLKLSSSLIETYGVTKATFQNITITIYDTLDCIPDFTNNETGTRIWFVNRFGAIDKVTLMGLKTDSYETSKNEYRANVVGVKATGEWGYDAYQRQKSILNKKGKRKFNLNTGWIAGNYNDKIQDLLLAEQVWINPSGKAYPVNIMTSNIQEKTDANEKIVNYAIEFEYANDIQNNIR